MKSSPLSLEQHVFKRVCLTASQKQPDRTAINVLNVVLHYAHHQEDPNQYLVALEIRLLPDPKPGKVSAYTGEISIEGVFRVNNESEDRSPEFAVLANAASILFGAVREMVLNITSRGPWPSLMLTTVSFIEIAKNAAEQPKEVPSDVPAVEPVWPWGATTH